VLTRKNFSWSHYSDLDFVSHFFTLFDSVNGRNKTHYGLPCPNISLKQTLHWVIFFHIFEHLEKRYFLSSCEFKWNMRHNFFDILSVERYRKRFPLRIIKLLMFTGNSFIIYLVELLIAEPRFCYLNIMRVFWKMDFMKCLFSTNKIIFFENVFWQIFWNIWKIRFKISHFWLYPCSWNILRVWIYRDNSSRNFWEVRLWIWRSEAHFSIIVFYLSWEKYFFSGKDFELPSKIFPIKPHSFCKKSIFILNNCLGQYFISIGSRSIQWDKGHENRIFFFEIYHRKTIKHLRAVLIISRKKLQHIPHRCYARLFKRLDIVISRTKQRFSKRCFEHRVIIYFWYYKGKRQNIKLAFRSIFISISQYF